MDVVTVIVGGCRDEICARFVLRGGGEFQGRVEGMNELGRYSEANFHTEEEARNALILKKLNITN